MICLPASLESRGSRQIATQYGTELLFVIVHKTEHGMVVWQRVFAVQITSATWMT
jgi:hypothetical protein